MIRLKLFLVALLLCYLGQGQNLVPNPSFEGYSICPSNFGQWIYVNDWISPYNSSADYFNGCAQNTVCGVPLNHFGYQWPADGDAYVGLVTYSYNDPDYREIMLAELLQPLNIGQAVSISFKVSCGGYGSWPFNSARWKARGPGLKFFVTPPSDWSNYLFPNSAALHMDTVLSDTTNWVYLSGSYTPDSAYQYVALANFYEDSMSWPMTLDTGGYFQSSYAFFDDICVSQNPIDCFNTQSIGNVHGANFTVWTTQLNGNLILQSNSASTESMRVLMHDSKGRLVISGLWHQGMVHFQLPCIDLANGVYLISVPDLAYATRVVYMQP